jgi:hypothetical protein
MMDNWGMVFDSIGGVGQRFSVSQDMAIVVLAPVSGRNDGRLLVVIVVNGGLGEGYDGQEESCDDEFHFSFLFLLLNVDLLIGDERLTDSSIFDGCFIHERFMCP